MAAAPALASVVDTHDAGAPARNRFRLPARAYLIGNSLGPLSDAAERAVADAMATWRDHGIAGWVRGSPPWIGLTGRVAELLSPIVGAPARDVCVTGSTTINLHQLLSTLYLPTPTRDSVVIDALAFPTDRYAVESHLRVRGRDPGRAMLVVPSRDNATLDEAEVESVLARPEVALAVLPAVVFKSGQLLDLQRVTRAARARGVVIGWDCSHAVGAVPLNLDALDADFAFWCSYKYLNGGPGATAGLWLNPRRHGQALPGMAGWFGVDPERQFQMLPEFIPADGAARMQTGSPHVLSLAPLLGALQVFADAGGIDAMRARSLALTQRLIDAVDAKLTNAHGVRVITPRSPARRGGHVAIAHPRAEEICRRLAEEHGVLVDFRQPNVLRITPAALYNTPGEVDLAVDAIGAILSQPPQSAATAT